VEGEVNGLMTYDRKLTKINPSILFRLNRGYVAPEIAGDVSLFMDTLHVPVYNNSPSGEIRYTTNGKDPQKTSPLYKTAIPIKKTTVIKARIYWPDGSGSAVSEKKVVKAKLLKGKKVEGPVAGIGYQYFENTGKRWERIPDWKSLKPLNTGVTTAPGISQKKREDDYGFVFEGFIKVDADGIYSFFVESDDGSKLFIDGQAVADNDGVHGTTEKKGEIALAQGFHQIRLEYFQGTGGSSLGLKVSGPGLKKQAVPAKMLFIKDTK
jgi:alpha-L-fucosidase